jgi:hypothetical protein
LRTNTRLWICLAALTCSLFLLISTTAFLSTETSTEHTYSVANGEHEEGPGPSLNGAKVWRSARMPDPDQRIEASRCVTGTFVSVGTGQFDTILTPFSTIGSWLWAAWAPTTPTLTLCYLPLTSHTFSAGTIYYIDSVTGSDDNPGTIRQPWQSVAKVNATRFDLNDRILFRRDRTWSEELRVEGQAGTSFAPIAYGAYGQGSNPSLSGLRVTHSRYIVFQDLTIERSSDAGVFIRGYSEHVTVTRCLIRNNESYGITIWTPGRGDFLISDSVISDNGSTRRSSSGIFARADNVEIARNVVVNNGYGDTSWGFSHGIYIDESTTGARIYDNEIYGNVRGHGVAIKGSAEIYRNFIHDNELAGVLFSEYVSEPVTGIITGVVHTNLLARNAFGVAHYGKHGAVSLFLYHNAFYHNNASWGWDIYIEADLVTLEIINNVVHPANDETVYRLAAQSNATIDHNCIYQPELRVARYGDPFYSWAEWQALGYDVASIDEEWLFVDPDRDNFELLFDSACIEAGMDVGLERDFAGTWRPQGAGFDIGPYEAEPGLRHIPRSRVLPEPNGTP